MGVSYSDKGQDIDNSKDVWRHVDAKGDAFCALADRIWDMPELCFQERRSAAEHAAMLHREGFRVVEGIAGIPTAVMGETGDGGPVIAFLGEYDALPGLSQEAGTPEHRPLPGNGPGHACGHNLLGAGAMLAAAAVKDWLAARGLPGRVRYYGCPAEEGGAAKVFMVRDGAFTDVDVAITWHPSPFSGVIEADSLAVMQLDFAFVGRAAHAGVAPHLGRSALDAVELMNVGVNYLREHIPSDARVHYAYLDAGGIAPNVVQAKAAVRYLVRAAELPQLGVLAERVRRVADGAALMTETTVTASMVSAISNLVPNVPLEQTMQANFERLGPPEFDHADRAFAEQIRATLGHDDIAAAHHRLQIADTGTPLCDRILPLTSLRTKALGSTDVGDVSWVVPTVQARSACYAIGTPAHSWQLTAQGKALAAHKGVVHVAKVMASTATDLLSDQTLLLAVKSDHRLRLTRTPYVCPLPPTLEPASDMAR